VFTRVLAGHDVEQVWDCDGAVDKLVKSPRFDVAYLDHDLGQKLDGTWLAEYIAEHIHPGKWPTKIIIHSWNDMGAKRMHQILFAAGHMRVYRIPFSPELSAATLATI
jgi:hypothetical protein